MASVLAVALLGFRVEVERWEWEGSTTDGGVVDHVDVGEVAGVEGIDTFVKALADVEAYLRLDSLAGELDAV